MNIASSTSRMADDEIPKLPIYAFIGLVFIATANIHRSASTARSPTRPLSIIVEDDQCSPSSSRSSGAISLTGMCVGQLPPQVASSASGLSVLPLYHSRWANPQQLSLHRHYTTVVGESPTSPESLHPHYTTEVLDVEVLRCIPRVPHRIRRRVVVCGSRQSRRSSRTCTWPVRCRSSGFWSCPVLQCVENTRPN